MADYKIGDKVVATYKYGTGIRRVIGKVSEIETCYLRIDCITGYRKTFHWNEIEDIVPISDEELIQKVKDAYISDDVSIVEWLGSILENNTDKLYETVMMLSDEQLTKILCWAGSDDWYVKNHKTFQTKKYTVSIAVDGRIDIQVEAGSFEEAKEKAISCFCDADLRNMECISFKAVNAEDEDGNAIDY